MKLFLTILILLLFTQSTAIEAQEVCKTHRKAPPAASYSWPTNTNVKVYFTRNSFTYEQQLALLSTMSIWTHASINAGAGVTFSYAGETVGARACNGCLTLRRWEVNKENRKQYALFYPLRLKDDGSLKAALITFDVNTIHLRALQGFMSHELGHGMGLTDCLRCEKKQTIMNGFPGINRDNGLIAPSKCDLEVVRAVYLEQSRRANTRAVQTSSLEPPGATVRSKERTE